ncbi:DUF6620 family protein [Nannocystaceae bacterium ST9]
MGLLDTILIALGLKKKDDDEQQHQHHHAAAAASAAAAAEPEEEDDDDDDGERRNYDLEAKDDPASFDFAGDIARYFTAEFKIEQAWEDESKRAGLFREYGVRDSQHWYQVKATFERWTQSPAGRAKYPTPGDWMQAKMTTTQTLMMGEMNLRLQGELKGEVEPVEGVSLDAWAGAQAKLANGGDVDQIIAGLGIDKAKWDRVSAEWNARMSRDTTATIATAYGKAFMASGEGAYGGAAAAGAAAMSGAQLNEADAPIPFERYVEIEQAQSQGVAQGKDAASILKSFGLTPMSWGQVGGWWSQYISQNAMRNNGALHKRYSELQAKYEAQYKAADADGDLTF